MKRPHRIAIIGCAGVPARYGGFETLAHQLVTSWKGKYDTTVYCSAPLYKKKERVKYWNGARLVYLPLSANGMQSIAYDIISIIHALFFADTILILGVSGCMILPLVRLFTNKKIIVNIDGLEWRRQKWNKMARRFLKFSERIAVRFAHADIADNRAIQKYTGDEYGTMSGFAAYGADHVRPSALSTETISRFPFLSGDYAFTVCRIEPENNIHLILKAFKAIGMPLVIVGNWKNSDYGRALYREYVDTPGIHLMKPIYNQEKLDEIRSSCKLYVHGHSAGGTNPSLVEAMFLGLPVIAFDVNYNRATTRNRAFYFDSPESLREKVLSLQEEELKECAASMAEIASEDYRWDSVAERYDFFIRQVQSRRIKPSSVPAVSRLTPDSLRLRSASHLAYANPFNNILKKAA